MPPKKKEEKPTYSVELRFGRTKSKLYMGIVGLPNVGKSSFFNLMTKLHAEAQNFPFCTIDPNKGRVQVPDQRYEKLVEMWKPKSAVPPWLDVTDIAGLVRGAHEGAGLGNAFLSHIQAVDGIYHMIRLFDNDEVTHVDDCVDPVRELETITYELCQKDLSYCTPIIEAARLAAKRANKKIPEIWETTMDRIVESLEKNLLISKEKWSAIEVEKINETLPQLITTKPMIYLLNMSEKNYTKKTGKWLPKVFQWINEHGGGTMIPLSVEYEQKLFDAGDDQAAIDQIKAQCEGPNTDSALPKIIKTGYQDLNLLYFFTCGEDEVKAWPVYKGALAPQAAGAIHTDIERCFIKAEVCTFDDFVSLNENAHKVSMAAVKNAGKYKMEGKAYVVQDGDIINFQHNAKK